MLRYTASADVGGKIAQPGSRLILGTARMLAGNFFETFAEVMKVQEAGAEWGAGLARRLSISHNLTPLGLQMLATKYVASHARRQLV